MPQSVDSLLRARAASVGATWNVERGNFPSTHGDFCGVEYDYVLKTVSLKASTKEKLRNCLRVLANPKSTLSQLQKIFGLLQFASVVTAAPVHRYYHAIKFIRRRYSAITRGALKPSDPIALWRSASVEFQSWISYCLRCPPRRPPRNPPAQPQYILFTDASLWGWGAVLVDVSTSRLIVVGESWKSHTHRHINELEILAVQLAVERFHHLLERASSIRLFVDNTTAQHCIRRTYSSSWELNSRLSQLLPLLPQSTGCSLQISYVPSSLNPSDDPSRGVFRHISLAVAPFLQLPARDVRS